VLHSSIAQVECKVPRKLEIAVIDDDESFRMALVDSLSSLGYGADGYASAEAYTSTVAIVSCDCIVTDIHMPGMSGLELIKWLKARGSVVPVVLITAHTEENLEGRAASAGAAGLLRKPFEIVDLVECIERTLRASR
jgi:FixJ family two-component response regulator